MAEKPLRPETEKLLKRCEELGLKERERDLLLDLLGHSTGTEEMMPGSYIGIEPQLTKRVAREGVAKCEADFVLWGQIEDLIRKLVGDKLMLSICTEPVKILQLELGFSRTAVVWLAIQLHLSKTDPELVPEMLSLYTMPFREMANKVVMPTLANLANLRILPK